MGHGLSFLDIAGDEIELSNVGLTIAIEAFYEDVTLVQSKIQSQNDENALADQTEADGG